MFKKLLVCFLLMISNVMAEEETVATSIGYSKCSPNKDECSFISGNIINIRLDFRTMPDLDICKLTTYFTTAKDNDVNFRFNLYILKCLGSDDVRHSYNVHMHLYSWTDKNPSNVEFSSVQLPGIEDLSNFNRVVLSGNYIRGTDHFYQPTVTLSPSKF